MKNVSIDISKKEPVTSSSTGSVQSVSWNPHAGYAREQQIQEERNKEYAAYQERQELNDPAALRLLKMEAAIAQLQIEVQELKAR